MNELSETVDVIIPVYNGAKFIAKAIVSVVEQKNVSIGKIIVVNDGSNDSTVSVIQSMNLPNIELITTPNRGVAAARNTGVAAANSEWVAFLDADDCWHNHKLENQLALARQHKVSFVCSATDLGCKKSEGIISYMSLWKGNFIATSSVVMTREHAQEIKPLFKSGMTFAEDYATWFKILTIYEGYFSAKIHTQYDVSPKPNYRLGSIFMNFIKLQKECISFLFSTKMPIYKKLNGLIILLLGTSLSILSIVKRFISSYIKRHTSPSSS
jgi:glycosyltransferase involved in cell wall biosynthesis